MADAGVEGGVTHVIVFVFHFLFLVGGLVLVGLVLFALVLNKNDFFLMYYKGITFNCYKPFCLHLRLLQSHCHQHRCHRRHRRHRRYRLLPLEHLSPPFHLCHPWEASWRAAWTNSWCSRPSWGTPSPCPGSCAGCALGPGSSWSRG